MISFLKLIRYKNLLMIFLTMVLTKYALIESFTAQTQLSNLYFTILILSVLLIAAGGNIINDIFDIEADKINKPNKVFVNTKITKKTAWILYYSTTILGVLLGFYLAFITKNLNYSLIFIAVSIGLFWYSYHLKKVPLLGNIIVSFIVALSILIIYLFDFKNIKYPEPTINSLLTLKLWQVIVVFSLFAFLTTLIREIIKDIEDLNGDLKIKAKTLPIVLGRNRAKNIAVVISLILLISLIQIATNYLYPTPLLLAYCFMFILIPLAYFTYQLWNAKSKKQFHFLSNYMKIIMLLGILSMILFRLN